MKKLLLFVAAAFMAAMVANAAQVTVTLTGDGAEEYTNLWAWDSENNPLWGNEWPGDPFNGSATFEVEGEYCVIFNNGGDTKKTSDLCGNNGDACYEVKDGKVVKCGEEPETGWFIAGGTDDGDASTWCCGKSWNPSGCKLQGGMVSYAALAEGTYKFKITNGAWDGPDGGICYGFTNLIEGSSPATTTSDNNIEFTLENKSDVTITFIEPDPAEESPMCIKLEYVVTTDAPTLKADEQSGNRTIFNTELNRFQIVSAAGVVLYEF